MPNIIKTLLWAPPPSDPPHLRVGIGGDIPIFPPLFAALSVGAGFALRALTGIQGSIPASATVRYALALVIVILGVPLKKGCDKALKEAGTKAHFVPVPTVADTGPYSYCRNPMYWALMMLVAVIGIAADTTWIVVGSNVVVWLYLNIVVVPAEESFLQQELGDAYKQYCASVKRWRPF